MDPQTKPAGTTAAAASPIPPTDTQLLDFLNGLKKSLNYISVATSGGTAKAEGWYVTGAPHLSKTAREAIKLVYPGAGRT